VWLQTLRFFVPAHRIVGFKPICRVFIVQAYWTARTSYQQTLWYLSENWRSFIRWTPHQWVSQCYAIECYGSFYCALFCVFMTSVSQCPISLRSEHPVSIYLSICLIYLLICTPVYPSVCLSLYIFLTSALNGCRWPASRPMPMLLDAGWTPQPVFAFPWRDDCLLLASNRTTISPLSSL
jgi:hypothetical protein